MVISGLQKNIEGSKHSIHQRTSRLPPKKTSEICTRPASFLSISPRGYQGCCSSKCQLLNRPLLLCHALEAVELQGSWNLLRGSLQWICFWLQNDSWWIVWKRSKERLLFWNWNSWKRETSKGWNFGSHKTKTYTKFWACQEGPEGPVMFKMEQHPESSKRSSWKTDLSVFAWPMGPMWNMSVLPLFSCHERPMGPTDQRPNKLPPNERTPVTFHPR